MLSNGLIIFLYCFFLYGFSNMMVFFSGPFKIFERIRNLTSNINEHFGSMFQCMGCFPANLGWVCSLVNYLWIPMCLTPGNMIFGPMGIWWAAMLFDCCFASGIVWFIHHIELFFENLAEGANAESEEIDDDSIEVGG